MFMKTTTTLTTRTGARRRRRKSPKKSEAGTISIGMSPANVKENAADERETEKEVETAVGVAAQKGIEIGAGVKIGIRIGTAAHEAIIIQDRPNVGTRDHGRQGYDPVRVPDLKVDRELGRNRAVWTSENQQEVRPGTDPEALLLGLGQRAQWRRSEISRVQHELGRKVQSDIDLGRPHGKYQKVLPLMHDLDPGHPQGNIQKVLLHLRDLDLGHPRRNVQKVLPHLHGLDLGHPRGNVQRVLPRLHIHDPRVLEGGQSPQQTGNRQEVQHGGQRVQHGIGPKVLVAGYSSDLLRDQVNEDHAHARLVLCGLILDPAHPTVDDVGDPFTRLGSDYRPGTQKTRTTSRMLRMSRLQRIPRILRILRVLRMRRMRRM